uniref:Uncharacterized protein n=1 Tax=Timema tahoe TaxID=61484 RepID=A0A7R9ISN8_9NEOP|nr:unnamed protein product [Timema tahoe]
MEVDSSPSRRIGKNKLSDEMLKLHRNTNRYTAYDIHRTRTDKMRMEIQDTITSHLEFRLPCPQHTTR